MGSSATQGAQYPMRLPGLGGRQRAALPSALACPIFDPIELAVRANRLEARVGASEDGKVRPVGGGIEPAQPQ